MVESIMSGIHEKVRTRHSREEENMTHHKEKNQPGKLTQK